MTWVTTLAAGVLVLALPAHAVQQVDSRELTIRLISTDRGGATVITDRPPVGQASAGDLIVVTATLRNAVPQFGRPKAAIVGSDTTVFRIRSQAEADLIVDTDLPGGLLRGAGRVHLGPKQTYRVTGGKGRFAKARGTGESVAVGPQSSRRIKVFRIRLA